MKRLLLSVLLFVSCILAKESEHVSLELFLNKYKPETIMEGTRILFRIRKFPNHLIEVALSFGVTNEMIQVAEAAIIENFTGSLKQQGEESRKIAEYTEAPFIVA
uniref:SERPIN domain-containing protein n=1 Tax=Heterorhabditis bacteriophora TaxID=37862 RepID=A0A1I7XBF6_HETBA